MLHNLFCTPVDEIKIENYDFIQSVYDLYVYCENNKLFKDNWMPNNDTTPTTYKHTDNILQDKKIISSFIESKCKSYLDSLDVDFSQVKLCNSWYNKQSKNQIVGLDNHRSANVTKQISGVYYLKSDKSAPIQFFDPRPAASVLQPRSVPNRYNSSMISFDSVEGTGLIFPSWLQHWVPPTKEQRISVSWNILLRGNYGEQGTLQNAYI